MSNYEEAMNIVLKNSGMTVEEIDGASEMFRRIITNRINDVVIPDYVKSLQELRYLKRKDFVNKLAPKLMTEMVMIESAFKSDETFSFVLSNVESEDLANAIFLSTYCRKKYGDAMDVENWKSMLHDTIEPDPDYKRHIRVFTFICMVQENYKPMLFGMMLVILLTFNFWCHLR